MNIAIIGLGSMGKRRIRLIKRWNSDYKIIGIDISGERCKQVAKDMQIETYNDIDIALKRFKIECAFISTPPLSHSALINKCLKLKIHVFTELNLVADGYDDNMKLANENGKVLFLSSTFLYRKEIKYINEKIKNTNSTVNYNYHVGQYLPDWHPWENYQDFFVGEKRTNGCREIFAIELPWISEVFGKILHVQTVNSKLTSLNIDCPDSYLLLLEHENGFKGSLSIDVVSRKTVRNLEIYGENIFLSWDGTPDGLYEYNLTGKENNKVKLYDSIDHVSSYSSQIIENAYYEEIENFFGVVSNTENPKYSFEKDKTILEIINQIEGV